MYNSTSKVKKIVLLIITLTVLILAIFSGYMLLRYLFTFSMLVLSISYLWAWLGLRGIDAHIEKSCDHCQVGKSFNQDIFISNNSIIPKLFIRVLHNTNLPGHNNRLVINLAPNSSYRWQTDVHCLLRGRYDIGQLKIEYSDPLGIFRLSRTIGDIQTILIYPAVKELSSFPSIPCIESGTAKNSWATKDHVSAAFGVREYVAGDNLSHIYWRSSAHSGKLMVKKLGIDFIKNIWLIVNMNKETFLNDSTKCLSEECITIAASLLKQYTDSGRLVGLITEGDRSYILPSGRGVQHFWNVMEALAMVKAEGYLTISDLVEREKNNLKPDSLAIIITPLADNKLADCLHRIGNRGIVASVIMPVMDNLNDITSRHGTGFGLTPNGIPTYIIKCS